MLLRTLTWCSREKRLISPAFFMSVTALGLAGFSSTVAARPLTVCNWPMALREKRFAAAASRLTESSKAIVWPRLSTARYSAIYILSTRTGRCKEASCIPLRLSISQCDGLDPLQLKQP
jgi:hypothetical protein